MTEGFSYATGALGGLLVIFGVFLLWWRRAGSPVQGRQVGSGAWLILLVGLALLALALVVPAGPGPDGIPPRGG